MIYSVSCHTKDHYLFRTGPDRYNYMKLISDGTVLKKSEQFGKYVSFFPFGGNVTDLTLEGFKYPLSNYCLTAADCGLTEAMR